MFQRQPRCRKLLPRKFVLFVSFQSGHGRKQVVVVTLHPNWLDIWRLTCAGQGASQGPFTRFSAPCPKFVIFERIPGPRS